MRETTDNLLESNFKANEDYSDAAQSAQTRVSVTVTVTSK